jgi:hypothetical protein
MASRARQREMPTNDKRPKPALWIGTTRDHLKLLRNITIFLRPPWVRSQVIVGPCCASNISRIEFTAFLLRTTVSNSSQTSNPRYQTRIKDTGNIPALLGRWAARKTFSAAQLGTGSVRPDCRVLRLMRGFHMFSPQSPFLNCDNLTFVVIEILLT